MNYCFASSEKKQKQKYFILHAFFLRGVIFHNFAFVTKISPTRKFHHETIIKAYES